MSSDFTKGVNYGIKEGYEKALLELQENNTNTDLPSNDTLIKIFNLLFEKQENDRKNCSCYINPYDGYIDYIVKNWDKNEKKIKSQEEKQKEQDRFNFIEKAAQFLYDWNKMQAEIYGPKAEMGPKDYTIPVSDFVNYMESEKTDKDNFPQSSYDYLKEKFIKEAVDFLQKDIVEDYENLIYGGFIDNFKKEMNERL